ncbi:MAG: hypothetical protein ACYS8Y_12265 [Planctomycetota bacterium]|jgi:hypothetical protein
MAKKDKDIKAARQSLDEILKRIEPYMPKARKAEHKPPRIWQISDSRSVPPLGSK